MKKYLVFLTFLLAVVVSGYGQTESIKLTEYDLPNGLHVILHQDHTTPNVVISLMYHVGSKNEDTTLTGFAHLFEHLMFEGTKNIARGDYFKMVQAAGGSLNANTSQDRTYYYELMPSNQLELALWMESERMRHAKIDTTGVNTQKGVVIEEKKQTFAGRPYGTWMDEMGRRAFTVHPYRWQTIGSEEHIRNSSFEDVQDFYKTYYVPNNAVLVVVGDFDEVQTKQWVQKYFAGIPKGTRPIKRPVASEPPQTKEVHDVIYDKVQMPALFMGYHAPVMGHKDAYAVEILCRILYGGQSSRFRTNIDNEGIALESFVIPNFQEHPGLIYIGAIANGGKTLEEVEAAIDTEIGRVHNELVSEREFNMIMAAKEYEAARQLTSIEVIAGRLADNYTYFKDAGRVNNELSFYQEITREDLQRVALKYFSKNNRVVLYYLPEPQQQNQ